MIGPLGEREATGLGEGFGPVAHPELAVDVVGVSLDRAHCDEEVFGNFPVLAARGEEGKDLQLPLAQGLRQGFRGLSS